MADVAPPPRPSRASRLLSWALGALCALVAYVFTRWAWGRKDLFEDLHYELLTFAAVWLVLEAIVRGWGLARRGR